MNAPKQPGGTPATLQPPKPKPLYPDTPWWASLIAVLVTAIVSVVGTAYALGGIKAPTAGVPAVTGIAVDTITYMPHILLLFGVLADMFTYDGVWSIPSLVGLLSIFANYFMQYFWKGLQELFTAAKNVANVGAKTSGSPATEVPPPRPLPLRTTLRPPGPRPTAPLTKGGAIVEGSFFKGYDGCSVQGFKGWSTEFAPQTLVVTATVFCYYIFDIVRNRGWFNSAGAITVFSLVYLLQVGVLQMTAADGSCGGPYGHYAQATMALFEGIVFGGSAYGIVQTYYPTRLPSSTVSPFPRKDKSELTMGPDGKMYDKDGYPYVILPNGQAVPDLSTQQSRNAFADIAGQNLGTGLPAKGDSCPNA